MLSGKSQEFQLQIFVETLESVSPADSTSDSLEYNMIRLEYSMRRLEYVLALALSRVAVGLSVVARQQFTGWRQLIHLLTHELLLPYISPTVHIISYHALTIFFLNLNKTTLETKRTVY